MATAKTGHFQPPMIKEKTQGHEPKSNKVIADILNHKQINATRNPAIEDTFRKGQTVVMVQPETTNFIVH